MSRTPGPDELASLESERDFLLRSLDDLEAEREAGNLEPERYQQLKDDYTARAAAVLRTIDQGVDPGAAPDPLPPRRKAVAAAAVAAFVALAAVVLALSLGDRGEGQTATGNDQSAERDSAAAGSSQPSEEALRRRDAAAEAVRARPDDPQAHLEYARALLDTGEIADAVKEFDTTAQLDPTNAEALAYAGWVVFLAARADPSAASAAELTEGALRRLDAAVAADPDYADARFFRGVVLLRGRDEPAGAVVELERYLALNPDGPMSAQVRELLDAARQEMGR